MALQKNIDLDTGIPANNCYIRIHSVEAEKQNEASDWSLRVLVNVYKDAETRNKQITVTGVSRPDYHLPTPINVKVYVFDYDPESEQGDLIALAYDKLKTHEDFSGASDV